MSDKELIEQLREYATNNGYSHGDYADVMLESAKVIERLTAENKELFDAMQHPSYEEENRLRAELAEAKGTIDDLRAQVKRQSEMLKAHSEPVKRVPMVESCQACGHEHEVPQPAQSEPVGVTINLAGSNGGFTTCVFEAIKVPAGTVLFTTPQPASAEVERDAARYRWLRSKREVLLLTGFFGNGCINRVIEEVDAEIDAAMKKGYESK